MPTDGHPESALGSDIPAPSRRNRHTFTIELQVDAATREVIASKAVQVETRESDAWPGWDPERLTAFVETQLTGGSLPRSTELAPVPPAEPEPLAVHRYEIVEGAGLIAGGSEVEASVDLDPAQLDLPRSQNAVARIDLFARARGTARTVLVGSGRFDVARGRPFRARLQGTLPASDLPFELMAAIRILVDRAAEPPRDDVGESVFTVQVTGPAHRGMVTS
jgi:hypothetical protein